MSDLDPARLLDAYRQGHEPRQAERARAFETVARRIDAGDPGLTLAAESGKTMSQSAQLFLLGGLVALVGVGLGFGLGEWGAERSEPLAQPRTEARADPVLQEPAADVDHSPSTPEPEPEPEPKPEPEPEPSVSAADPEESPASTPQPAKKQHSPAATPKPETPSPAPVAAVSTLREEMRLLSQGRKLLREANTHQALAIFVEHRKRFPAGELAEEREVHRHEALCALNRSSEARDLRAAFARDYPSSPHGTKIRRGCKEQP